MKRNTYNLGRQHLTTANIGTLAPIYIQETLPNDTFRMSSDVMIRLSPMAAPVYQQLNVRVHHFWCSTRNLNDRINDRKNAVADKFDWESFITGQEPNPNNYGRTTPPVEFINHQADPGALRRHLGNYFGLQLPESPGEQYSVLQYPFELYRWIFSEYYADQDLQATENADGSSGARLINWEKDYFTTARPWPTKDDANTTIPIVGGNIQTIASEGQPVSVYSSANGKRDLRTDTADLAIDTTNAGHYLTASGDINIQEFRRALALNRWSELQAKYGSRYIEYMRYYLGSQLQDNADRPIYLGGGSAPINISEVLQTAPETSVPGATEYGVGDMYGHGVSMHRGNQYQRTFDEHGYVMTLLSVRPKAMYTTGIERMWMRGDRLDFYDPLLTDIGMQPITESELYYKDGLSPDAPDTEIWAWQDRYQEYREARSYVSGEMKSVLNYWHLGREFDAVPNLNQAFLEVDDSDSDRIFNVQNQDHLWINVNNRVRAKRRVKRPSLGRTI